MHARLLEVLGAKDSAFLAVLPYYVKLLLLFTRVVAAHACTHELVVPAHHLVSSSRSADNCRQWWSPGPLPAM